MMTPENMLARYKILHELGRGAMGAVYAARDRETGAVVALKRLDTASLSKSDAKFAERFLKHVRSARALRHRNIVTIHDAGEVAGTVYVAMEMLEGESLRKILADGPLPIARAIQIARDIACGLAYAHLEGVVHGGLKPSDIVVSRSGVVKITDFGIGQLGQAALLSGARAGGLGYVSPEQVRGDPVDHRCDIFSLGALFYEMLGRRAPFGGDSPKEIMQNILHAAPPLPSELNPHVPRALDGIVSSMLAAQAAARMPGVPVLLRDLQGLEEGLGLGSGPGAATGESTATVPPVAPEPSLRMPDPDRSRDRAPIPPIPLAAEQHPHRDRTTDGEAFDYQKAMVMMERESRRERLSGSRPPVFAALALGLAVLGIAVAGFKYYGSDPGERPMAATRMQEALARALKPLATEPSPSAQDQSLLARASEPPAEEPPARMASRPIAPSPVVNATEEPATAPVAPASSPTPAAGAGQAQSSDTSSAENPPPPGPLATEARPLAQTESRAARPSEQPGVRRAKEDSLSVSSAANPRPPEPVAQEPRPLAQTENSAVHASEKPASAETVPARALPRAKQPAAEVPQQPRGGTARVILSVSPRGEVYIDGKHHGTTPPITTLDLEPGMHRIEVRSGSRTPYLTYMTVQTGEVRHIRYDFDVSRAVYPRKSASWQRNSRAAR